MLRSTTSRFGELSRVFKGGQSELLNGIARLSVLYEDLRLEMEELRILHDAAIVRGKPNLDYRVMYFIRRALATLVEFRGGLTTAIKTKEFKDARNVLSSLDPTSVFDAERYLASNWARIKELRNEFAGHVQMPSIEFALAHLSTQSGRVTWNRDPERWTMGLECDFAGKILAGVIGSKLQNGADVQAELRKALEVISMGFNHAQISMVGLVHAFLWDRFGR